MSSLRDIKVVHPEKGELLVKGVKDKLVAVQRVARIWGGQWSRLAMECTFYENGVQI